MDYFFQKIKLNFQLRDDLNHDFLYIEWTYIDEEKLYYKKYIYNYIKKK